MSEVPHDKDFLGKDPSPVTPHLRSETVDFLANQASTSSARAPVFHLDCASFPGRTDQSVPEFPTRRCAAERRAKRPARRSCAARRRSSRNALSRGADRGHQRPPEDGQGHAVPLLRVQGGPLLRHHRRRAAGHARGDRRGRCRSRLPLERTVEALARTVIGYFWERRDFFVLLHRHEPKLEPGERAEWQKRREELIGLVGARSWRPSCRATAAPIRARLAAEMLLGMIRAVCLYRDESDRVDDLARLVTTVFVHGVPVRRSLRSRRDGAAPPPQRRFPRLMRMHRSIGTRAAPWPARSSLLALCPAGRLEDRRRHRLQPRAEPVAVTVRAR